MRLWQVKTLSIKGKGFKGPLKGAEMALHRWWVRKGEYGVVRGGTAQVEFFARPEPNSKLKFLSRPGTNPKLKFLSRTGTNSKLELLSRTGTNPKPKFLSRLGTNPKPELLAPTGPNSKPPKVFRGETVVAMTSALNICHPKLPLHSLKFPLCPTLFCISFSDNRRCWPLSSVDALVCYLVTGITKDKGSPQ